MSVLIPGAPGFLSYNHDMHLTLDPTEWTCSEIKNVPVDKRRYYLSADKTYEEE